jgi:DNA polymerase-3 subunit epsilon
MTDFPSLAFVDLETTGLSPRADRITEIGVVTADANEVTEWTTLLNPGKRIFRHAESYNDIDAALLASAPSFKEIAPALAQKLAGRLFIAHNARFDYSFLKAAFDRLGIEFCPQVLCSVMLSRKLYAGLPHHDLDSVMERHGLQAEMRHRALPDAQLLWQFWRAIHRDHSQEVITNTISTLLAGPVFPPHLDPSLVDRLPEAPGIYVLHGDGDVLHVSHAGNLRAHLRNYFRLDRSSAKALAVSHRVRNITWRVTAGALGARLQLSALSKTLLPAKERQVRKGLYSWQLNPEEYPSVELFSVGQLNDFEGESYGLYDSQRKARNDLRRLACEKRLCHFLLGIAEAEDEVCTACHLESGHRQCSGRIERLKHLARAVAALTPLRVEAWPFAGTIGIRERGDIHLIHDWRYLGTARNEAEIDEILQTRASDFDEDVYMLLAKKLPRLSPHQIIRFPEDMKRRRATDFEPA